MSKVAFVDENCIKCETLQISRVGLGRIDKFVYYSFNKQNKYELFKIYVF